MILRTVYWLKKIPNQEVITKKDTKDKHFYRKKFYALDNK